MIYTQTLLYVPLRFSRLCLEVFAIIAFNIPSNFPYRQKIQLSEVLSAERRFSWQMLGYAWDACRSTCSAHRFRLWPVCAAALSAAA